MFFCGKCEINVNTLFMYLPQYSTFHVHVYCSTKQLILLKEQVDKLFSSCDNLSVFQLALYVYVCQRFLITAFIFSNYRNTSTVRADVLKVNVDNVSQGKDKVRVNLIL